ncbi:MAG: CBS domain-containing protein [Deltaproteobacteria bacterium]|nr:CBS domain-containing protein [Deltaproteobacteria bacterium]
MNPTAKTWDPERITVQRRQTLGGASSDGPAETVHCPARERTLSLDECLECHASDGFVDENGSRFVRCRRLALAGQLQPRRHGRLAEAAASQVFEVMSADVTCAREDLSAEELAKLLLERGYQGVPVVDGEGHPTGVVSLADLVASVDANKPGAREVLRDRDGALADRNVGELMTPGAVVVSESASVFEAARLMAHRLIHRLPVVNGENQVVGVITSIDVLRWLASQAKTEP